MSEKGIELLWKGAARPSKTCFEFLTRLEKIEYNYLILHNIYVLCAPPSFITVFQQVRSTHNIIIVVFNLGWR
jgi:hypothetical protein